MKKIILFTLLTILANSLLSQDTLRINITGSSVSYQVGRNPIITTYRQVLNVSWGKDSTFVNIQVPGYINIVGIPIRLIYINNVPAVSFSNMNTLLGALITVNNNKNKQKNNLTI